MIYNKFSFALQFFFHFIHGLFFLSLKFIKHYYYRQVSLKVDINYNLF